MYYISDENMDSPLHTRLLRHKARMVIASSEDEEEITRKDEAGTLSDCSAPRMLDCSSQTNWKDEQGSSPPHNKPAASSG